MAHVAKERMRQAKLLELLEEKARREREKRLFNIRLYDWQQKFISRGPDNRQRLLMAANRVGKCVTAETLIDHPDGSSTSAKDLFKRQKPFEVMAWDGHKPIKAIASGFIKKPPEECYRVRLKSGQSFECAGNHRVLTSQGWFFFEDLLAYTYYASLLQSNLGDGQQVHALNVENLSQTPLGCRDDCFGDRHQYDEQLLWDVNIARASFPLQSDAPENNATLCSMGGQAYKDTSNLLPISYRPTILGDAHLVAVHSMLSLCRKACNSALLNLRSILTFWRQCSVADRIPRSNNAAHPHQDLSERPSLVFPFNAKDEIVSIEAIGRHDIYDFSVPGYGNYITQGVVHHNTFLASYELACHLTGQYPDDWNGIKFDFPINAWALGVSGEQIRDVLQATLLGTLMSEGFDGEGLVPPGCIGEVTRSITPKLSKDVAIKHISGGWSKVSFKSYSQGQHALMGSSVDFAVIDEEPEDPEIYPQVVTRTATGNKGNGGYVVLSFTPENGHTLLVDQFLTDIKPGQYLQNVTWDDAPHLTEETKQQLLQAIPEYQREMRSKGIPLLGSGRVFPIAEEKMKCDGIELKPWWPRIVGMDFGWDHPTAAVWVAWDRDNDVVYIYDCYREREVTPVLVTATIRSRADWIPVAWPHDGLQHDKGSGVQLAEQYRQSGLNMLDEKATFEDGSNGVEAGVSEMLQRMQTGRLRVFSGLSDWFEEHRMYHRKNGKIVKERDDLMAATRYALMMLRFAEEPPSDDDYYENDYHDVGVMGY